MKNILLTMLFLPLVFSCANIKPRSQKAEVDTKGAVSDNGYRCVKTIQVGTHLKTKVCTTQAQREEAKRKSDAFKAELRNQRQKHATETNKN